MYISRITNIVLHHFYARFAKVYKGDKALTLNSFASEL
jgi:hypothetical protein